MDRSQRQSDSATGSLINFPRFSCMDFSLQLYLSVVPALLAALLSLGIRSAEPPTPSCQAVVHIQQPFIMSLKRVGKPGGRRFLVEHPSL